MPDAISRQQAIKAIEEEWDGCCSEYPATQIIYDTTEAIEKLPSIQSEPHWIPTSERLPKISEDVLLSYFDEVTIGWLNSDGSWSIFDGWECVSANEVSAWMPLPEPYKGVTE